MGVFQYAMSCEAMFERILNECDKERKTTFFSDLSIAEWYGINAVKETYRDVMASWGDNLEFMCEWVLSLNHKIWQHYKQNKELAKVYDDLWRKADDYCCNHFKGEDLEKYYSYMD